MSEGAAADRPAFFATPVAWRRWLVRHHARTSELWVGFHKKGSGTPSITWPESVDQALCFGWIDGVRKRVDETRYVNRFTPRRPQSNWSAKNVARVRELTRLGLMHPAGLAAFAARDQKRSGLYAYEQHREGLDAAYARRLKANAKAWAFFTARPPWYQRTAAYWVMSAKQEATRLRRLATLIEDSAHERTIAPLTRPAKFA